MAECCVPSTYRFERSHVKVLEMPRPEYWAAVNATWEATRSAHREAYPIISKQELRQREIEREESLEATTQSPPEDTPPSP